MKRKNKKWFYMSGIIIAIMCGFTFNGLTSDGPEEEPIKKKCESQETKNDFAQKFSWWPTDAKPGPFKDETRSGYWWWPRIPGSVGPVWGNRGFCYVNKVIFDYKEDQLPPPKPQELRASLLIKKIVKNVKIYFDYNASSIRDDAQSILDEAVKALQKNPQTDILITGNCDIRGSETYNEKLGNARADAVKQYMLSHGISEERIRIISRGKLDAVAPIQDLVGMQKDRNAQFMVAEVEEVMIPYPGSDSETSQTDHPSPAFQGAKEIEEGKFLVEKEEMVEGAIKVTTKEYVIQKGDTLWSIAEKELGSGHRWKYLYEVNKERIKNPNRLKAGTKIVIPVE